MAPGQQELPGLYGAPLHNREARQPDAYFTVTAEGKPCASAATASPRASTPSPTPSTTASPATLPRLSAAPVLPMSLIHQLNNGASSRDPTGINPKTIPTTPHRLCPG